jgi:hypothetical protein
MNAHHQTFDAADHGGIKGLVVCVHPRIIAAGGAGDGSRRAAFRPET